MIKDFAHYACPKCKGTGLKVQVKTEARVLQDENGDLDTVVVPDRTCADEWNNSSLMTCEADQCGFSDCAGAFLTPAQ